MKAPWVWEDKLGAKPSGVRGLVFCVVLNGGHDYNASLSSSQTQRVAHMQLYLLLYELRL